MKLIAVTNNTRSWNNAKLLVAGYNITIDVVDCSTDDWQKIVERARYDFIVCDNPAAYKKLPPACTIAVFSSQPSATLLGFVQDIYLSLATTQREIPNCVLWLSDEEKKQVVLNALQEWGINHTTGENIKAQRYLEEEHTYHILDDANALQMLTTIAKSIGATYHIFLLPSVDAAEAFAGFINEIIYNYTNTEARLKLSKDLGVM